MHFWNLWPKGFQTVYRLSELADILEAWAYITTHDRRLVASFTPNQGYLGR